MTDIFISYKREEKDTAQDLAKALTQSGWDVWWDPDLVGGDRYDDVIEDALKDCLCAIVLWSKRATKSDYVRDEASFALSQNKLLPIRLDESELQLRFRNLHTLDFSDWDGSVDHPAFKELSADIHARLGNLGKSNADDSEKHGDSKAPDRDKHDPVRRRRGFLVWAPLVLATSLVSYFVWNYFSSEISQPVAEPSSRPPKQVTQEVSAVEADFEGGSRQVYAADFSTWEVKQNSQGRTRLDFGNSFALEPASNSWLGAGVDISSADLRDDFVIDINYRIAERETNASLNLSLTGTGSDAEIVNVFVTVWETGRPVYTLTKGRRRSGGGLAVPHVITEETIAERNNLPAALSNHDWSSGNKLTLKREGGQAHLFLNGHLVDEFTLSRFLVGRLGISAAWDSKFVITSIVARVPD